MRVSDANIFQRISFSAGRSKSRLDAASQPLLTGQKITRPSEDPILAQRQRRLERSVARTDQFQGNISKLKVYYQFAETSVQGAVDILADMSTTAIGMVSDSIDPGSRKAAAKEIERLMESLQSMGNAKFGGRYIFAGRTQADPAYDAGMNFVGDTVGRTVPVGEGLDVPGDLTGPKVFGDGVDGPTAFQAAEALKVALENDDTKAIQDAMEIVQAAHSRATFALTEVGFALKDLSAVESYQGDQKFGYQISKAQLEQVDVAEAVSQMSFAENVYKASLQVGAKLSQVLDSQTRL